MRKTVNVVRGSAELAIGRGRASNHSRQIIIPHKEYSCIFMMASMQMIVHDSAIINAGL